MVVDRIVERTLEPILARRSEELAGTATTGQEALDSFLELAILDPAMGSGHFLVSAAGYMAQYIATDPSFDLDLDLVELQRLVAERCLYGVDLIPMATELANLALWLGTVKGDEPLTFLSNLRSGDSLVGAEVGDLLAGGETVFAAELARDAERMLAGISELREQASTSGEAVHAKQGLAAAVEALRQPLERFASESISNAFADGEKSMFHWQLEFPEVFLGSDGRPREDGGFDAIVGNPPYIRIQGLGRDLAAYCRERYETASGAFDAYTVFVERALSLLNPSGRLGFIVPNKFTKLSAGKKLRAKLVETGSLTEIVDFADAQVFAGATNYTCILGADRAGADDLSYRRLPRSGVELRDALIDPDALPAVVTPHAALGEEPWLLLAPDERRVFNALWREAIPLGEATESIFTGLQTGADPVYILENRGWRAGRQLAYSRASERELELEPDLLHPLASGSDVEPYAFKPLESLLLFPYRREDGEMRVLTEEELAALPATAAYLREHEEELRGRERGRMDHERWYAFTYPKSLGKHDSPKLGVAATVPRLEVAIDPLGGTYFHNVRVNGIEVADGVNLWSLMVVLNSRAVDYAFRRIATDHANGYFAANKQFIAPLPIRVPDGAAEQQLDALGRELFELAQSIGSERQQFLAWLAGAIGARPAQLAGVTQLRAYEALTIDQLLALLRRNQANLSVAVDSRAFRQTLETELQPSVARIAKRDAALRASVHRADQLVYDLYELSQAIRQQIDFEYA